MVKSLFFLSSVLYKIIREGKPIKIKTTPGKRVHTTSKTEESPLFILKSWLFQANKNKTPPTKTKTKIMKTKA